MVATQSNNRGKSQIAICISDLHCGCQYGLCPDGGIVLDGGGTYTPSAGQVRLWGLWLSLPNWIKMVCSGKPFVLVLNGDTTDGRHHNSTTQISQNIADQLAIGRAVIVPFVDQVQPTAVYMIRGTEAHVGPAAENEETLAQEIGAIKETDTGRYSRNDMLLCLGPYLAHFAHSIGITGSQAYETTALCKELAETNADCARWGMQPPDWIVRSHRHRHAEVRMPSKNIRQTVITTPGWQLKTGYVYRSLGGRTSLPQFGAVALIAGDQEPYSRSLVYNVLRSTPENASEQA